MNEFKINKKNKISSGFTQPEGFFDDFSIQLNSALNHPKTKVKIISINKKKWLTSVAAVLILSLSATIYLKMVVNIPEDKEVENYLTSQSELSQYELTTLLDKKDIENLSLELNIFGTKTDEDYKNANEIENYITEIN